jgi:hypothetical protein
MRKLMVNVAGALSCLAVAAFMLFIAASAAQEYISEGGRAPRETLAYALAFSSPFVVGFIWSVIESIDAYREWRNP